MIIIAAEGVAKIYDTAVKQCPKNEEFHSHLFMAYVRISDYKKQQQVRSFRSYFSGELELYMSGLLEGDNQRTWREHPTIRGEI